MTIAEQLTATGLPQLETELLLAFVLQQSRTYLHVHREIDITDEQQACFLSAVARRLRGEPIAYIIGEKEFWSLCLQVNADVLIPRPETELLVELILTYFPDQADFYGVDLGTGSGAIAIALGKERPRWQLTAVDNSGAALRLAQHNAQQLAIDNVSFLSSHWCEELPDKKFHFMVSNPPYLSAADYRLQQHQLGFEPLDALVTQHDGLAAFEQISAQSSAKLLANGYLFFEHGYSQGRAVQDILRQQQFINIKTLRDLSGHDRVTYGHTAD